MEALSSPSNRGAVVPGVAARTFFLVPVVGWLVRDAIYGLPDAKYYFIWNLVFTFAALTYLIGYPFIITFALAATAVMMAAIIGLTATDLIEGTGTARKPQARLQVTKRR
jgi:hypothetical protein